MANAGKKRSSGKLAQDQTPTGNLPPFEIAKAYAFDVEVLFVIVERPTPTHQLQTKRN
jgi:hypothetical protein